MREAILEHLTARPGLMDVVMFWQDYISGLLLERIIDANAAQRLSELFPKQRYEVVVEAMCGTEYFKKHPTREAAMEDA